MKSTSLYGLAVDYYLADSVGEKDRVTGEIKHTQEYLIELANLIALAEAFSLTVVENINFIDFYLKYRDEHKQLFERMGLNKFSDDHPAINQQLWDISHCFRALVFQKKEK